MLGCHTEMCDALTFIIESILITSLVMVLSTYMNNPDYGVVATITQMMQPLMGMSPYIFIVCALAIAVVMTHFATNMVLCIVFMPFMVTFAANVGMNPTGIVALLFFSCQLALATPGGGAPLSAMFYGMDWCIRAIVNRLLCIPMPKRQTIRGELTEEIAAPPSMEILCMMDIDRTEDGYKVKQKPWKGGSMVDTMGAGALYITELGTAVKSPGETIEVTLLRDEWEF